MNGLEKILEDIRSEARANADAALRQANTEAQEILEEARRQSEEEAGRAEAQTDERIENLKARYASSCELRRRQSLLAARQALIAQTLEEALRAAQELPEREYFALLSEMAARAAHPEAGEICLGERDLARLPEDFMETLAARLPEGASLTLSSSAQELPGGGFLLRYGGIEENGSFEAVFAARAEQLQDIVRHILFAG
ncbi:MAG: V-type ATP synthase subunit E family protein [Eubacteriales bacterium]|nr:V-type ATP synthase subunit E family protein [Eubacteriales bacterium]